MLKVIVVDDEQLSLDKMEKLLLNSGLAQIVGRFTEGQQALTFLEKNRVDAVFLDIEMPDMDGIELSNRILKLQSDISIVFVTDYNQYAVEAFRLNALDYLLKPVTADRLGETLRRTTSQSVVPHFSGKLQVQCFGKFCVTAGNRVIRFRTEKAAELLAFLIDYKGGFISRDRIMDYLWEDFDGDRALVHFNPTLHYVKKALLQYGIDLLITYDRGGYKIDFGRLDCDYLKFSSFAENAQKPGPDNISEYEAVVNLYTGEYLSG